MASVTIITLKPCSINSRIWLSTQRLAFIPARMTVSISFLRSWRFKSQGLLVLLKLNQDLQVLQEALEDLKQNYL